METPRPLRFASGSPVVSVSELDDFTLVHPHGPTDTHGDPRPETAPGEQGFAEFSPEVGFVGRLRWLHILKVLGGLEIAGIDMFV